MKKSAIKLIAPIAVLIAVTGVATYYFTKPPTADYLYDTVQKTNLTEVVATTGKVKAAENVDLSFERGGNVNQVMVQVGDRVKTGQTLVTLSNADVAAQVQQAQAVLDKQLAGATPEYLAQLQAALEAAQANLSQAQGSQPGVEGSKPVMDSYEDAVAKLQTAQIALSSAMTISDNILGIDNTFGNDAFEGALSTMDLSKLIVARNQYNGAKTAKNNFDQIVNQLDKNSEHTAIDAALNTGKDALTTVKNLLFAVSTMLDNTAPAISLPQTSLDNLKNSVLTVRTNITAQYSGLVAQEHALTTARNNYYSLQAAVDKAQAAYNDAKNPPREVDLAATKASLALAQATFNKTILRSPIDGIVSKQDAKVGMIVGAGTQITSIINDKLYQVEAYIPQSDLAKVAVGNPVKITLDNNPGVNFEATLIKINPAGENLSNGVIAYKITVQFNQEDERIKSGLTANIKITTAAKNGILSIPTRDVVQKNGNYYVQLKNKNNQLVEQLVQIGIKSSDDRYEIITGLNESDQVVSYSQK